MVYRGDRLLDTEEVMEGEIMREGIFVGVILIIIGLFHIIAPHKVSETIRITYKHSPFIKNNKQLTLRQSFVIFFGIIWMLVGLFVFFKL